jgi:hypothetical protein
MKWEVNHRRHASRDKGGSGKVAVRMPFPILASLTNPAGFLLAR